MDNNQQQAMPALDQQFLSDIGATDLPQQDQMALMLRLQEELEERIGDVVTEKLSDEQLDELEELMEADNPQEMTEWLEVNCPDYKDIVAQQTQALKDEVLQNKDTILGNLQNPQVQ